MRRLRSIRALAAATGLGAGLVPVLSAQPSVYETEPNDTPATAAAIEGEVTLMGTMGGSDQDGFLWTVSDVGAQKRWTFDLTGIPGRLTIVEIARVEPAGNGTDVAGVERLLKIGSRDGVRPAVVEDLVFEPGEYLVGLAQAGGGGGAYRPPVDSVGFGEEGDGASGGASGDEGGYRLAIREGSRLLLRSDGEGHADRASAASLRLDSERAGFVPEEEAWYEIDVDARRGDERWDVEVQVPVGRTARATLLGPGGRAMTEAASDSRGRLALRDLALAPGRYLLRVDAPGGQLVEAVSVTSVGVRVEGQEAEPNDRWAQANRVDATEAWTGRMGSAGESDLFSLHLGDERADRVLRLRLQSEAEGAFRLSLLDGRGDVLQRREGTSTLELRDLVLAPGDYGVAVERGPKGAAYRVSLEDAGEPEEGREREPNDSSELASGIPAQLRVKGRFAGEDTDFYRLLATGEPQLWRLQVLGDGIEEVAYHDGKGSEVQKVRAQEGQRRVRLDNLFLLPGRHTVSVRGRDGDYTLLARPLGPPSPEAEREPDDDESRAETLAVGGRRTGTLPDAGDRDVYRFVLPGWDRIRLTVEPPADGEVTAALRWGGVARRRWNAPQGARDVVLEGLFPPGEYGLELTPTTPSEGEYAVSLDRLERFGCPIDCEPNDDPAFASPLPPGRVVEGLVGEWREDDWYALPVAHGEAGLRVTVTDGDVRARLGTADGRYTSLDRDADGTLRADLPVDEQAYLVISGRSDYRVEVGFDPAFPGRPAGAPPPVQLGLDVEQGEVAAYAPWAQRVAGELDVVNRGVEPLDLELETAASHRAWRLELDARRVWVAGGGRVAVPVTVRVPPDARGDRAVRLSVVARAGEGVGVESWAEITPRVEREPIRPQRGWSLPESLVGGLNAAWTALGARRVADPSEKNEGDVPGVGSGFDELFDEMAMNGMGMTLRGGGERPVATTVELAGGPVEVVGVALDPSSDGWLPQCPKDFGIQLSADGASWQTVLEGTLDPVREEQAFVLDQPTTARFARLLLSTNWAGEAHGIVSLGEWKVIVRPGLDLSGGAGFDLADPALGGHVVRARPTIAVGWDGTILPGREELRRVGVAAGEPFEWVVGFHHDRAAQIVRLEWEHPREARAELRIPRVRVAVSLDSPVGPWRPLGDWDLSAAEPEAFEPEQPVWARFVRYSVAPAEQRRQWVAPREVRIWERPTGGGYRSILGEWDAWSQAAGFEAGEPVEALAAAPATNGSRDRAAPLAPGETVKGEVALGRLESWYSVTVPAGANTLTFELSGDPTVRAAVTLEDAEGRSPMLRRVAASPRLYRYEATVEPGTRYLVGLREPPRNVVFVWDTSASVNRYLPLIYSALASYVRGVQPGRDTVNLLPFGRAPLLEEWYGEPHILQAVLNDYPRRESSSDAERTLATGARALAERAGTKAMVLITDAATTRYAEVWKELASVRPRIFALHLDAGGSVPGSRAHEVDLMEDWSRVAGGHYSRLTSQGEMEVAFDRASALLRGPAGYALTVGAEHREAPGPGALQVVAGAGGAQPAGAVELILDASGSMLQRLGGKRRIAIAKEVLTEAVREGLPDGTPLALRVFGHREPGSCRTDLEVPLAPLDREGAARAIAGIEAMNLARTPIADSLAHVATDLAGARGSRVVVLVTDGEETCDGDPEAVLDQLREKGVDVSLNIVGFAIDDADLEAEFERWARLGGGRYFGAGDEEGLGAALEDALRAPFTVFDAAGEEVGRGVVGGEPVELEAGVYRVVVGGAAPRTFDDVEIPGEELVSLALD